jgi:hypothetical protein
MVGDDLSDLAGILRPLIAAIADDGDATRRVVVERVATNDAAGKVFAFCRTRFPVQDVQFSPTTSEPSWTTATPMGRRQSVLSLITKLAGGLTTPQEHADDLIAGGREKATAGALA